MRVQVWENEKCVDTQARVQAGNSCVYIIGLHNITSTRLLANHARAIFLTHFRLFYKFSYQFTHVMQKYANFAYFARLYFLYFTTFCNQTLQLY